MPNYVVQGRISTKDIEKELQMQLPLQTIYICTIVIIIPRVKIVDSKKYLKKSNPVSGVGFDLSLWHPWAFLLTF